LSSSCSLEKHNPALLTPVCPVILLCSSPLIRAAWEALKRPDHEEALLCCAVISRRRVRGGREIIWKHSQSDQSHVSQTHHRVGLLTTVQALWSRVNFEEYFGLFFKSFLLFMASY